jgi:iron(III) transport system ATP-binding protein
MSTITISGLRKAFDRPVLVDVDLTVAAADVTAILGASGTGKSTLLRCIAGLLRPDQGTIHLGDQLVDGPKTHVPANRRRVGLVPQEGALFPHLSVADNVAYGLRGKGKQERVAQLLELVGLPGTQAMRPHELSGGMQQRVAVARALAPRPSVLVLDEPFSALDAGLREGVREDVFAAIRSDGTTAVLVTHDQDEAFAVADRVAVMMSGSIVQHDVPTAIYERPATLEVAQFVGDTVVLRDADHITVFRPEQLNLQQGQPLGHGVVTSVRYHGHDSLVSVQLADRCVQVRTLGMAKARPREEVTVYASGTGVVFPSQAPVAQDRELRPDSAGQVRVEIKA